MKRILVLIPLLAMSLVAFSVVLAEDDPFVGTWKLNLAKSTYVGQQAPKSVTKTVVAQGAAEKVMKELLRMAVSSCTAIRLTSTAQTHRGPATESRLLNGSQQLLKIPPKISAISPFCLPLKRP
jgi:hypothetical protein